MPAIVLDSIFGGESSPDGTRRRGPPISLVHQSEEGEIQMPELFVILEEVNFDNRRLWVSHNGDPNAEFKENHVLLGGLFRGVRVGDDAELVRVEQHPEFRVSCGMICLPWRPISFRLEVSPKWKFQYTTPGGKVVQGESLQFNQRVEYAIGLWDEDEGEEEEEEEEDALAPDGNSNTSTSGSKRASESSSASRKRTRATKSYRLMGKKTRKSARK